MAIALAPNPALTVALALCAGIIAQAVARHLMLPGIVLLLALGVLLGPDALGVIQPGALGHALQTLVGFAVAVILFEGAMNLDLRRLQRERIAIRRLVTVGALLTWAGAALAVRLVMGWDWRLSILFGALVIVTGPTVVTPLLSRIRVKTSVGTVLRAEGVLIDPIGASLAVVALELLYGTGPLGAGGLGTAPLTLGTGGLLGLAGGLAIAYMLRVHRLVPEGLENVFVLSAVLALFQTSEAVHHESGLAAVTTAGLVVGNLRAPGTSELREFKEQLTLLLIGLLFTLLAADVRTADVIALGWPGVTTVLVLMLVVRPIQAFLCTLGSKLTWRERIFVAWIAPRGIVAAAVASLFAQVLEARGVDGGAELRALVFLVIAITVTVSGLTGGLVAGWLGVRRPARNGFVLLGATPLGLRIGRLLRDVHPEVLFIDSSAGHVRAAEEAGFRVLYGQALDPKILTRADVESRIACLALTPNEEINLLFGKQIRTATTEPKVYVALRQGTRSVTRENVSDAGAATLFGRGQPLATWSQRITQKAAEEERWRLARAPRPAEEQPHVTEEPARRGVLLMMILRRDERVRLIDETTRFAEGDEVDLLINEGQRTEASAWLQARGWEAVKRAALPDRERR